MTTKQPESRVWLNGSVYSPADPFATGILMTGATVAWVGSDDAARAMAGPGVTPGDLRAAVVTPAFVAHHRLHHAPGRSSRAGGGTAHPAPHGAEGTGGTTPGGAQAAASPFAGLPRTAQGYGAVELLGPDASALAAAAERVAADGAHPLPVLVRAAVEGADIDVSTLPSPALGFDAATVPGPTGVREAARQHLVACTRAGIQAVLVLPTPEDGDHGTGEGNGTAAASSEVLDAVLDAADAARSETGERAFRARGHRLVEVAALDDAQCARLATLGLTVSCRPGAAPLRELARAGVPVTLLCDDPNPWTAVKAALEAPDERMRTSARAAFLALTRGAWRAHPGGPSLAGQLVPGAEATLAVWDAESVVVQQAQGTGASWSTDPRARTPVLPALDDARLPRCEATVVAGVLVSGAAPRP
ncbi:hypothetical protein [Kocuria sp.]|uniref:hypothetical protein n=1 Tax=Kocuria sp. TaxID=1871328 RepID=UPI0026DBCC01|nr:hypothetical protein [Kocuria sp.]MDO4919487.1 hypothetical protein [Kocuria sp.]